MITRVDERKKTLTDVTGNIQTSITLVPGLQWASKFVVFVRFTYDHIWCVTWPKWKMSENSEGFLNRFSNYYFNICQRTSISTTFSMRLMKVAWRSVLSCFDGRTKPETGGGRENGVLGDECIQWRHHLFWINTGLNNTVYMAEFYLACVAGANKNTPERKRFSYFKMLSLPFSIQWKWEPRKIMI